MWHSAGEGEGKYVELCEANFLALLLVVKQSLGDEWNIDHVTPAGERGDPPLKSSLDKIHRGSINSKVTVSYNKPLEVRYLSL